MRRERETKFLSILTFHLTPPHAAPCRKLLVWPRLALKINHLPLALNLNSLFFSNSKILSQLLPGMTSFTSQVLFPIWGFCDICDCHIRPARMNTCTQCVHLTNPCTKVLSLTNSKGKIYKMKIDNIKKNPSALIYNSQTKIIFKQIYLTHKCSLDRYHHWVRVDLRE